MPMLRAPVLKKGTTQDSNLDSRLVILIFLACSLLSDEAVIMKLIVLTREQSVTKSVKIMNLIRLCCGSIVSKLPW